MADIACDFSHGQFLLGLTSKGLTNQRLAVVTYQLLAGAVNRTLVLPSIRSGNVPMCRGAADRDACMARLPFSALYDIPVMRSRLPHPFRVCCCASDALERGHGAHRLGRDREATRRVPLSWHAARAYAARRLGHGTAAGAAWLLLLSDDTWIDFGGSDSVDQTALAVDRALVFAPEIRRVAKLVLASMRGSAPGRRLTWLHYRVESDWKGYGTSCPFHDGEAIVRKVAGSVVAAQWHDRGGGNGTSATAAAAAAAGARRAAPSSAAAALATAVTSATAARAAAAMIPAATPPCGSVPPSRGDVVYVAGGVKHASTLAALAALFGGGVRSAVDIPAAAAFVAARGNATGSSLRELNLFGAALDFMVGLGASTWIVPSCSTFSSEVVLLAHLGKQRPPTSAWTYAGDPRGPRLQPFMCDGHSAHMAPRHLAYHPWPRIETRRL